MATVKPDDWIEPTDEVILSALQKCIDSEKTKGEPTWIELVTIEFMISPTLHTDSGRVNRTLNRMAKDGQVVKWDWTAPPRGVYGPRDYIRSRTQCFSLPGQERSKWDILAEEGKDIPVGAKVKLKNGTIGEVTEATGATGYVRVTLPTSQYIHSSMLEVVENDA